MKTTMVALLATAAAFAAPSAANAALVINISEVGANLVVTGAGSINTTGLTAGSAAPYSITINPAQGAVFVGPQTSTVIYRDAISNPGPLGSGGNFYFASSGTGNAFGLYANQSVIMLPEAYVSGSALAGTATYSNASFASVGLTQGRYLFNVRSGDTITVLVGASAVPEPASWAMMIFGVGVMGSVLRRRQKITTRVAFAN